MLLAILIKDCGERNGEDATSTIRVYMKDCLTSTAAAQKLLFCRVLSHNQGCFLGAGS